MPVESVTYDAVLEYSLLKEARIARDNYSKIAVDTMLTG